MFLSVSKSIFDTLSNETRFAGLSFEKAAARRSALATLAHLRAEKYFCRRTRRRQKCLELYLRLRAQTLRGFFDSLWSAIRSDGAFVMPYPNRTARLRKRFRFFSLTVFWQVYILNMAKGTILL